MKKILRIFRKRIGLVIWTLLVLLVGSLITIIISQRHLEPGEKELKEVISAVEKLMLLPKDEEPTLAAVTEKDDVKDPFLATKVENGDQVLVYTNNRIVIVFRPSINKIVTVGTVSADPAAIEATGATLTILDGSNNEEKTDKIIKDVRADYPDMEVKDGGKTNRQDFPNTIVIDNTNSKDYLVDALVKIAAGMRGIVPISEAKPTTDLLIIVGKD